MISRGGGLLKGLIRPVPPDQRAPSTLNLDRYLAARGLHWRIVLGLGSVQGLGIRV